MPTPTVGAEAPNKNSNSTGPKNLLEIARGEWNQLWPTPSAHEARLGYQDRSDPTKKGSQESLFTAVVNRMETFPTPDVGAAKGRGATSASGRSRLGGALNPAWVEWLMGVPTGWTALGSWETE